MAKLIMMRGLPSSGKSTKAKELVEVGAVRVNRDLLREMLDFSEYSPANENYVVEVEKEIVCRSLNAKLSVVVDDCNLNPSNEEMWYGIAKQYNAKFEIMDVDTPMDVCIERDKGRAKEVGESVIKMMALQYNRYPSIDKVIICDIDGTIADIRHRVHHVQGEKKDWQKFFATMDQDTVREGIHMMLKEYYKNGNKIIFVSARPEDYREVTEKWLRENVEVPYELLIMRRKKDSREDSLIKTEIYHKYLSGLKIETVIDDRPRVIRAWEALGLPVTNVGDNIEF